MFHTILVFCVFQKRSLYIQLGYLLAPVHFSQAQELIWKLEQGVCGHTPLKPPRYFIMPALTLIFVQCSGRTLLNLPIPRVACMSFQVVWRSWNLCIHVPTLQSSSVLAVGHENHVPMPLRYAQSPQAKSVLAGRGLPHPRLVTWHEARLPSPKYQHKASISQRNA